jgi:hypothetical protein
MDIAAGKFIQYVMHVNNDGCKGNVPVHIVILNSADSAGNEILYSK